MTPPAGSSTLVATPQRPNHGSIVIPIGYEERAMSRAARRRGQQLQARRMAERGEPSNPETVRPEGLSEETIRPEESSENLINPSHESASGP